jgi:N-acylneuraminate cytidylyltransferase
MGSSKTICIIPAKQISNRLPGKNFLNFNGLPLYETALKLAVESGIFSTVILSSDKDLESKCIEYSNSVTKVIHSCRPLTLTSQSVRADDVVRHEIGKYSIDPQDLVCCLFATTPYLQKKNLIEAKELLVSGGVVFGITETDSHPYKSFLISDESQITPLFPEKLLSQSNDWPTFYVDAGQFYFAAAETWLKNHSITASPGGQGLILDRSWAIDLNTERDWDKLQLMRSPDEEI